MYKVTSYCIIKLTGILVTSASIAEDEKQISETAAKLATCREVSLENFTWRSMFKKIQFIYKYTAFS